MRLNCSQCGAIYSIDDELIGERGVKAQCPACGNIQMVMKEVAESAKEDLFEVPRIEQSAILSNTLEAPIDSSVKTSLPELPSIPLGEQSLSRAGEVQTAATGGMPGDSMRLEEPVVRCERCGGPTKSQDRLHPLCERCQQISKDSALRQGGREWWIKTPDGVVVGPLTVEEIHKRFRDGLVTGEFRAAFAGGDYKLISSFPEFAVFFKRPGEAYDFRMVRTPKRAGARKVLWVVLGLVVLGAAVGLFVWLGWGSQEWKNSGGGLLEEVTEKFLQDVSTPTGTVEEAVATGRRFMLLDDRISYMRADLAFKNAFLLDPTNADACAGWVQNRALLDYRDPDVSLRKMALDLIDFSLRKAEQPQLLRAKAFLFFSLNQREEARKFAEKALEKLPADPESLLILGASYLDASTQMAIDLLNRALAAQPELNLAVRFLGEAHLRIGKFSAALGFLRKRLDRDPGHFESLSALAKIYTSVGEYEKAKETYELILAAEPTRIEPVIALARLFNQALNDPRKVMELTERFLGLKGQLPPAAMAQVLTEQAVANRLLGDMAKAHAVLEQAIENDPFYVPAQYQRAIIEHERGDLKVAYAHYRELLAHRTRSARLRARLADIQMQLSDYRKAFQELAAGAELNPNDLDILLMLATGHALLDDTAQAYLWLRKVVSVDPFYTRSHPRITAYFEDGNLLRWTEQRALQVTAKYEDDPLLQSLHGIIQFRLGMLDKAKNKLRQALALDSDCFPANLYMAVLEYTQGRFREAQGFLQQARNTESLHPVVTLFFGRTLNRLGRPKQAVEKLRTLLGASPGDANARLALAEVLAEDRHKTEAVSEALRVYQRDPRSLWARKLLFQLGY